MLVLMVAALMAIASAPRTLAADVQKAWSPRHPAWPALTENHRPELCSIVLKKTEAWFASDSASAWELFEQSWGLYTVGSEASKDLPWGFAARQSLDLDGDGSNEELLVVSKMLRYENIYAGFVGDSSANIDDVVLSDPFDLQGKPLPKGVHAFPLLMGKYALPGSWFNDPSTLYRWGRGYYVINVLDDASRADVGVFQLNADGTMPLVCRISSESPIEIAARMQRAPEVRTLIMSLRAIGHAGGDCGTLGAESRHNLRAEQSVLRAAVRPWSNPVSKDGAGENRYFEYTPRMWRFLDDWTLGEAWNKREYRSLQQALEPARRAYAAYLAEAFGLAASEARAKGDEAIERLIASWFLIPSGYGEDTYIDDEAQRIEVDILALSAGPENSKYGKTRLMTAAHMNRLDLVRDLLEKTGNPNATTRSLHECGYAIERGNRTALMYAAENASPQVMKALLEAGANPDARDTKGFGMADYLLLNPRLSDAERKMSITDLAKGAGSQPTVAGFDCSRARTRPERTICGSEALRLLDGEMAKAFRDAIPRIGETLRADQKRWAAQRGKDCAVADGNLYVQCLADVTAGRERYLRYLTAE